MPQKDGLCGPFWGAPVLPALGRPAEAETVALSAGTARLSITHDGTLVGTSATGLARAVQELSVLPVAGPWNARCVVGPVEAAVFGLRHWDNGTPDDGRRGG